MTGRKPTLAQKENGEGKTERVNLNLDSGSMGILASANGSMGAYVRQAIASLLSLPQEDHPPQVPPGQAVSVFALRAPESLLNNARGLIGRGTYTTLSGLARTAIHRSANNDS